MHTESNLFFNMTLKTYLVVDVQLKYMSSDEFYYINIKLHSFTSNLIKNLFLILLFVVEILLFSFRKKIYIFFIFMLTIIAS